MRTLHVLIALATLLPAPALLRAQAAPVPPPAKHVDPSQAARGAEDAAKAASTAHAGTAPADTPRVLDSVIAIINGDVLLESDVEDEQRFELLQLLPESQNTPAGAAQRLISRTLIVQEMKAQNQAPEVSDAEVDKSLDELRSQIPACAHARCATAAGWASFLGQQELTPEEVRVRWRQRLAILSYLDLRFRAGIRVPKADIAAYYQKTIVAEFDKKHAAAPPLKTLAPKIEEVLLQKRVNSQIGDWIKTLRQQGSVKILVPAYGETVGSDDDDTGGGA